MPKLQWKMCIRDRHIGGSPALDFQSYTRYMVYGDNEGIGRRGYRVGNPLRIAFANDFFIKLLIFATVTIANFPK